MLFEKGGPETVGLNVGFLMGAMFPPACSSSMACSSEEREASISSSLKIDVALVFVCGPGALGKRAPGERRTV